MPDDYGPLNVVASPILERVAQEERLSGDQQQKQRALKSKLVKKLENSVTQDEPEELDDLVSSNHIDVRI